MPILPEQIKVSVDLGMVAEYGFIEFDAQTGSRRKGKITVGHLRYTRRCLLDPRVREIVKMLLNHEIRRTRGEMQRSGSTHGTTHIVRRNEHIVDICPRRQPSRERETAKVRK